MANGSLGCPAGSEQLDAHEQYGLEPIAAEVRAQRCCGTAGVCACYHACPAGPLPVPAPQLHKRLLRCTAAHASPTANTASHTASCTACRTALQYYGDLQGASYYSVAVVPKEFCTDGVNFGSLRVSDCQRLPAATASRGPNAAHCPAPLPWLAPGPRVLACIRVYADALIAGPPGPRCAGQALVPHGLPAHRGLDAARGVSRGAGGGESCEPPGGARWRLGQAGRRPPWLVQSLGRHDRRGAPACPLRASRLPVSPLPSRAPSPRLPAPLPKPTLPPQIPRVDSNDQVQADAESVAAFFSATCAPGANEEGPRLGGGAWDAMCTACKARPAAERWAQPCWQGVPVGCLGSSVACPAGRLGNQRLPASLPHHGNPACGPCWNPAGRLQRHRPLC